MSDPVAAAFERGFNKNAKTESLLLSYCGATLKKAALCIVQVAVGQAGRLSLEKLDDGCDVAWTNRSFAQYPPSIGAKVKSYVCAAAVASTAEASRT